MKKSLVLLTNNYPSKDNIYANGFVHSRVKYYLDDFDVTVIIWSQKQKEERVEYVYENVSVVRIRNQNEICKLIGQINPFSIAIHFVETWMFDKVIKPTSCPITIWVHGVEALGWYRRLFNKYTPRELFGYIFRNTFQLYYLSKIIKFSNKHPRVKFVFVSEWMKRIAETDTMTKIKNYEIIPNPIDTDQFLKASDKTHLCSKILLIRPFASRKYANDIAVKAIVELSKTTDFEKYKIAIYGDGPYFEEETKPLKGFANVFLHKEFIPHEKINAIHDEYGIFLCPTRQDAQGVSMCEAMASGLVVITSNNTAIPEFVDNLKTGILTNSYREIAEAIIALNANPELFGRISECASKSIEKIAGRVGVISREIDILKR